MKKYIFFLILIIGIFYVPVSAKTFYEGEYIDGIYMHKVADDGTNYYQKARYFRDSDTNEEVYCIQPFSFFVDTDHYEETVNPAYFSTEQSERIGAIAHYGYGYKNHTDEKWYAITQMMIWKTANPNQYFYFSDTLKGGAVPKYEAEMQEIENLIEQGKKLPSFNNQTISTVLETETIIEDKNNVLNEFISTNPKITISGNNLIIKDMPKGTHQISLIRNDNMKNNRYIFYITPNGQDLVKTGDVITNNASFSLKVEETMIKIIKIDQDTKENKASGDATFEDTTFEIINEKEEIIKEIIIKEDKEIVIKNLPYGKYYIKEKKAGKGYHKNDNKIEFNITENQKELELKFENKVIKAKVKIKKLYGTNNNFIPEKGISFNIYNSKKELIKTIETNELGYTEITLPYGKYRIEQLSTTEGYEKINPIEFEIIEDKEIEFELKDYQIEVPNTNTNIIKSLIKIIKKVIWTLIKY